MGSSTKASFTPFVDTRVYQTSPTDEDEDEDEESSATGRQQCGQFERGEPCGNQVVEPD